MSIREAFMAGFVAGLKKHAELMGKQEAIDFLKKERDGSEPIYWTVGLSYRNPSTHNVPLTLDEAIEKIRDTGCWIDVGRLERNGVLYLDFLSENDMW